MTVPFPTADQRRIALHLDGVRYSFRMTELAAGRLRATLDEVAALHRCQQHSEECITSALLDAWSIVDMCHRVRELIQQMPYLSQKLPWVQVFLRRTAEVEELRHYVQHLRRSVTDARKVSEPLWGSLCWIPTDEDTACFTIFSGHLLEGLSATSISYDTVELRYTAEIQLSAGGDTRVDLLSVAGSVESLRAGLIGWLREKPNTVVSEGRTLVWKSTVVIPNGSGGHSFSSDLNEQLGNADQAPQ